MGLMLSQCASVGAPVIFDAKGAQARLEDRTNGAYLACTVPSDQLSVVTISDTTFIAKPWPFSAAC